MANRRSGRLGVLVRRRRTDLGWGQDALAARAGISLRALRDIEAGRVARPRTASVHRLADALDLPVSELVDIMSGPGIGTGVRIEVLGPLIVRSGERSTDSWSPQIHALLALLALQANRVVSLDEIVEYVWDGEPPATYRSILQTHVTRLRRTLFDDRSAPLIRWSGAGYVLEADAAQLDVLAFDDRVAAARARREAGDPTGAEAEIAEALDLWRGPVVDGISGRLAHHPAAVSISRRRVGAAQILAELAIAGGNEDHAAERLRVVAHAEPLDEPLHILLMRTLAGAGRRADAIAVFADLRVRLVDQLGIEPGPDAHRLYGQILAEELPAQAPGRRAAPIRAALQQAAAGHHTRGQELLGAGDLVGAVRECERSAVLYGTSGDSSSAAMALVTAGMAAHMAGRLDIADGHFEHAMTELEKLGEAWRAAYAARALAVARLLQGRGGEMRGRLLEALSVCEARGDVFGQALLLGTLSDIAHGEGDTWSARSWKDQADRWWAVLSAPPVGEKRSVPLQAV
jgi:DNA-binding SARP family transcriptional activator/DNA-binding XRE family transcriptional regulator